MAKYMIIDGIRADFDQEKNILQVRSWRIFSLFSCLKWQKTQPSSMGSVFQLHDCASQFSALCDGTNPKDAVA